MRQLSDEDIHALVQKSLAMTERHRCRFSNIETEDFTEMVNFYKQSNRILSVFSTTIIKTLTVLGTGAIVTLVGYGVGWKLIQAMGL